MRLQMCLTVTNCYFETFICYFLFLKLKQHFRAPLSSKFLATPLLIGSATREKVLQAILIGFKFEFTKNLLAEFKFFISVFSNSEIYTELKTNLSSIVFVKFRITLNQFFSKTSSSSSSAIFVFRVHVRVLQKRSSSASSKL